ncbi:hypothetical protein [Sodaliphilus sp.]|uniref:hypothetical protein n=1 Tax=Sodaliphilus sp. TaxID=2815818 RepID=UPI00388D13D2
MPITKRRGRLRVKLPDGSLIQERTSADTFTKAIDIAVSKTNINEVLNTNIIWCKFPLISMDKNIYTKEKYIKTLKKCECGLYVNTCSNNKDKRKLLLRILDILKLNWNVTII